MAVARAALSCLAVVAFTGRHRDLASPQRGSILGALAQIQECHADCKTCHLFDYNLEWHCLECNPGKVLWVDGCISPCLVGYFRNGYNCEKCPGDCLECTGGLPHECTRCAFGFGLDFRGLCIPQCATGYFPDRSGLPMCYPCDAFCRSCVDGYKVSCTNCYVGYQLRILEARTGSGECMQTCPQGFFRDAPDDLRCIQCTPYCASCESLYMCFECEETASLYRGMCYPLPKTDEEATIDFNTYLESGAGIQWDESTAPDWNELMLAGAVR